MVVNIKDKTFHVKIISYILNSLNKVSVVNSKLHCLIPLGLAYLLVEIFLCYFFYILRCGIGTELLNLWPIYSTAYFNASIRHPSRVEETSQITAGSQKMSFCLASFQYNIDEKKNPFPAGTTVCVEFSRFLHVSAQVFSSFLPHPYNFCFTNIYWLNLPSLRPPSLTDSPKIA